jgi:hypothetical protein
VDLQISIGWVWVAGGYRYSISRVVGDVYQEQASSGLAMEVEVCRRYLVSAVAVDVMLQLFEDGIKVLEVEENSLSNAAIDISNWADKMEAEYLTVQTLGYVKRLDRGTICSDAEFSSI